MSVHVLIFDVKYLLPKAQLSDVSVVVKVMTYVLCTSQCDISVVVKVMTCVL